MSALRSPIPARRKVPAYSKTPLASQPDNDTAALVRKADQELRNLLDKLQIPQRATPPHRSRAKYNSTPSPELKADPAPTPASNDTVDRHQTSVPKRADAAADSRFEVHPQDEAVPTEVHVEQTNVHRTPLLPGVAIVVSAVALFSSILVYQVHDGQLSNHNKELTQQRATVSKLAQDVRTHDTEIDMRLTALQRLIVEVKYPPPAFDEAQNLFRAGRYADAEAAYHAFLLRSPNSRVADVALHNAAVASAMQNNCTMSATYLSRLKKQFPDSPLLIRSKGLGSLCNTLRTKVR